MTTLYVAAGPDDDQDRWGNKIHRDQKARYLREGEEPPGGTLFYIDGVFHVFDDTPGDSRCGDHRRTPMDETKTPGAPYCRKCLGDA